MYLTLVFVNSCCSKCVNTFLAPRYEVCLKQLLNYLCCKKFHPCIDPEVLFL
jgi:hypothetical protein